MHPCSQIAKSSGSFNIDCQRQVHRRRGRSGRHARDSRPWPPAALVGTLASSTPRSAIPGRDINQSQARSSNPGTHRLSAAPAVSRARSVHQRIAVPPMRNMVLNNYTAAGLGGALRCVTVPSRSDQREADGRGRRRVGAQVREKGGSVNDSCLEE